MESRPFLEDIYPKDVLYAVTIRSPVAKGVLIKINVPELPLDYTLITAKDIPGENKLEDTNIPILADSNLSYSGEPVAILLGPDKTKLEELAAKFIVNCEKKEAVFSCNNETSEPLITREITIGDTSEIFEKSEKKVSCSYKTGIQDHWYAEPVGAISWFKENNVSKTKKTQFLVVRTATQWPFHVKRSVSRVLGIENSLVSVEPTELNLHMDGKLWYPSLISCHAALGTYITKKPVRLILKREEDFLYTPKRCSTDINIVSSLDENGKINAAEIDISVNLGAYMVNGEEILDQICLGSIGFHDFPNIKLTGKAFCTNIPPQGPFSGFGLAQGLFASERHISIISESIDKDPADWRAENHNFRLIQPASMQSKNSTSAEDIIFAAAKMSDYHRKWSSYELLRKSRRDKKSEKGENYRGIGIAAGFQGNGMLYPADDNGNYSVEVTLTKDGFLEIKANITSSEDYNKLWEKVAAETMSIEPEMVRVISSNASDCGPSCSSRNITTITKLVEKCCASIRKQRFHDPLPITVRRSVKPQNGSLWGNRLQVKDVNGFLKPGFAAAVVEVTIDLVECIPIVRGVWICIDGGKIISVNRSKRSITRAATQSLGWAFTENIEYINGILPRDQYNNFTIFSPVEIPPVHIDFINNTGDSKGIGELPFTCIPAAFMQAVSQAMDHYFKTIPLKRKEIWEIVQQKNINTTAQVTK